MTDLELGRGHLSCSEEAKNQISAYPILAFQVKVEKDTMLAIMLPLSQKLTSHRCCQFHPPKQKAFTYLSCPAVPDRVNYSSTQELEEQPCSSLLLPDDLSPVFAFSTSKPASLYCHVPGDNSAIGV